MLNALMGLLGAGYFAPPPVVKVNSNSNYSQNSNSSGSHSGVHRKCDTLGFLNVKVLLCNILLRYPYGHAVANIIFDKKKP